MENVKSIPIAIGFKFFATIILIVFFISVGKSQVCKPSFVGSGQSWGLYTSNVTLDSINNTSTMPANAPYYTYYNTQSTTVKTGYGYWVKVTSGPNSIGYGNIAVWFDFNGNDTFETKEKIGEVNDIPASTQDSIYFNVPSNADSGLTKMRVIFSYYYTKITACQNLYYGDCEDYNINIKYVPCTSPPTAGSVISDKNNVCTSNTFILSLQGASVGAGQSYQWQKSSDNSTWTNIGSAIKMTLNTSQSDSTYYRCLVTCSGYTDSTQGLLIAQKPATNCYCHGKSYYPTFTNIGNVTFGKFSNGTDTLPVDYNPNCKHGYTDFTNVGYIPLIRGNTYPFAVTQICGGYFYQGIIEAWIDYNQNGDFESSEQIYSGSTATGLYNNTIHKNVTIPNTVKTGITGMRVKIASANSGVCDTAFIGESEDYEVYIYDQKKIDAYLYNIESPVVKSCYSNTESAKLAIYNAGTDTIKFANNNMDVHLDMSNLNTGSLDSVFKSGYLAPASSMMVNLNGSLDMSKYAGTYDIKATINLNGDSISYNDKVFRTYSPDIVVKPGYLADFENYMSIPKSFTAGGFAMNNGTGVNYSNSLSGVMLYNRKNTATSELIGPLTKFSTFKIYYKASAVMPKTDTVFINISIDCGVTYKTIYKILTANSSGNSYSSFQYDLGKYSGNNLIVKIITTSAASNFYYIDFDNFAVADKPQINLGNDTVVCDKVTLYGNPQNQPWNLQWSKYKATSDTLVAKSSGIYWCTATDSIYGISNTDTVHVDVYNTPNLKLGADQILCVGNTTVLNPGTFNGYKFNWSTGDTTSTISVSTAGTYIVTVSAPPPASCFSMDTIKITTVNKPSGSGMIKGTPFDGKYNNGTLANPDDACAGNTLTYEVTPPTGYTNAQYGSNWFITPNIVSINGTKPVGKYNLTKPTSTTNGSLNFMPDIADADSVFIITFTILDANTTCDVSISRYLKVNPAPVVNLGSDQEVCPGDLVYWNTGGNYPQYLWSNGSTSSMISVSAPASYWLKVTDAKGCTNSDTADLLNYPLPSVNLGYDRGSCDGNAFILDAGNQSGYLWSTGATSQSIKVNKTGAYWAKVFSNDGCIAIDTVKVEILPKIKATFNYTKNSPSNIKFTPDSTQYTKYIWNFGDSNSASNISPIHAYSSDGIYTVKLVVIAKYGCTDSSTQTININTGINEVQLLANDISVFPNPYNHEANLNFSLTKNSQVNIELYDIYGRKINTLTNSQMAEGKHSMLITTHNTAQAVYILRMVVDGQSTTIRLVDLGGE